MKTITTHRALALGTLATMLATTLAGAGFTAAEAQKSSNAWRNIAIGAGAVTAYGVVKKNKTATIAGGAGTAYSLYRYKRARDKEKKVKEARRIRWYKARYGRNWRTYYRRGT